MLDYNLLNINLSLIFYFNCFSMLYAWPCSVAYCTLDYNTSMFFSDQADRRGKHRIEGTSLPRALPNGEG